MRCSEHKKNYARPAKGHSKDATQFSFRLSGQDLISDLLSSLAVTTDPAQTQQFAAQVTKAVVYAWAAVICFCISWLGKRNAESNYALHLHFRSLRSSVDLDFSK